MTIALRKTFCFRQVDDQMNDDEAIYDYSVEKIHME